MNIWRLAIPSTFYSKKYGPITMLLPHNAAHTVKCTCEMLFAMLNACGYPFGAYCQTFCVFTSPFMANDISSPMSRLVKKFCWLQRSLNHLAKPNLRRRAITHSAHSSGKGAIWYQCHAFDIDFCFSVEKSLENWYGVLVAPNVDIFMQNISHSVDVFRRPNASASTRVCDSILFRDLITSLHCAWSCLPRVDFDPETFSGRGRPQLVHFKYAQNWQQWKSVPVVSCTIFFWIVNVPKLNFFLRHNFLLHTVISNALVPWNLRLEIIF